MARRVFLSFLGTNNYIECNYYLEGHPVIRVDNTKYIQEALIRLVCMDFDEEDLLVFFLTEDAKDRNWCSNGQWNPETKKYDLPNQGLKDCINLLKTDARLKAQVLTIDIPEGYSEEEIWEVFGKVMNVIEEGDRITLDITHAFRSLPMLSMVLLNFAEATKNIEVDGVYYGAFEKLGPAPVVKKIPIKARNAPIIDLSSFVKLQQWTFAARQFMHTGNPNTMYDLVQQNVNPVLEKSKGKNGIAKTLKTLINSLRILAADIYLNRGAAIIQGKEAIEVKEKLQVIQNKEIIPALGPLLTGVKTKIDGFRKDGPMNWLTAVDWCVLHKLYPQAITQLQEGIVTHICKTTQLDCRNRDVRNVVSGAFAISQRKFNETEWGKDNLECKELTHILLENKNVQELAKPFDHLSKLRNDVNHGGYGLDPIRSDRIVKKIKVILKEVKSIISIE